MGELNNIYGINHGVVVTLIKVYSCRFVIQVKDRYNEEINHLVHDPPFDIKLNRDVSGTNVNRVCFGYVCSALHTCCQLLLI